MATIIHWTWEMSSPLFLPIKTFFWWVQRLQLQIVAYHNPQFNEVERGCILVSPCLSICLSIHPSVDRIMSALYLHQYMLAPFHIYTSYQANAEGIVMPHNLIRLYFLYLIFMSQIVLYFLHSTSVLSFYIAKVLTPSITCKLCAKFQHLNFWQTF